MKKIVSLILSVLLFSNAAYADTCGAALVGVFTPAQAVKLCKSFGSAVNSSLIPAADNTYDVGSSSLGWRSGYFDTSVLTPLLIPATDLVVRVDADSQRLYTLGASSDTAFTLTYGDGGTTAVQQLTISAATADADDDGTAFFTGGGAASAGRGAFVKAQGADATGDLTLSASSTTSSLVRMVSPATNGQFDFSMGSKGVAIDQTIGFDAYTTGLTLGVDSGTAASACKGTSTHNGTTAVTISTTCAATGMVVLTGDTSDPTGSTASQCWFTNIVNGVSFDVDCDAANDATFSWLIVKEA